MSETTYTLKITDRQSPYYGQVGRWKDKDEDGLTLIRFPGGESEWFMPHEFVDTDGTIYTKPAKGKKWHIQNGGTPWTICGQMMATWYISGTPGWRIDGENEPMCKRCQAIDNAIRTGEGVPF